MARNLFADDTAQQASTTSESANSTSGGRNLFAEQSTQQSNVQPQMSAEESLIVQATGNNSLAQAGVATPAGSIDFSPAATAVREQAFRDSQTPEQQLKTAIQAQFLEQRGDDKSTGAMLQRQKLGIALRDTEEEKTDKAVANAVAQVNKYKPQPKEPEQDVLSNIGNFISEGARSISSAVGLPEETIGDTTQGLAQGVTFGAADEIEGYITSLVNDGVPYTQARDAARARYSEAQERSPALTTGGEIAGGLAASVLPFGGATALVKANNLTGKSKGAIYALTAGAEGAAVSAGTSEADASSDKFLADVAEGTAIGLAFGASGELIIPAANGVRNLYRSIATDDGGKTLLSRVADASGVDSRQALDDAQAQYDRLYEVAEPLVDNNGNIRVDAQGKELRAVAAADLDLFTGITRDVARTGAPDDLTQLNASSRANGLRSDITNGRNTDTGVIGGVDPIYSPRGDVNVDGADSVPAQGRQIGNVNTLSDTNDASSVIIPNTTGRPAGDRVYEDGSGVVGTTRLASEARRQGNLSAADSYTKAYDTKPNQAQFDDVRSVVNSSPSVQSAYQQGLGNARDLQAGKGLTTEPSVVQVLDETSKVLSRRANNAETGESVRALTGLKSRIDDIAYAISPDLEKARNLSREGQRAEDAIDAGAAAIDQDIDSLDSTITSFIGSDREFAEVGAGRTIRNKITDRASTRSRDIKTNKLLTQKEVDNYNRLVDGNTNSVHNLEGLIDAEAIANRTENLANVTPQVIFEDLKSTIPGLAKDAGALTALGAFIMNPNIVMAGLFSTRYGQAVISRTPRAKLHKETQKEAFRLGLSKAELSDLLEGKYSDIPAEKLQKFAYGLASGLTKGTASENAYKELDSKVATR